MNPRLPVIPYRTPHASLYIHIPFCAGACDYCDFYSIPVKTQEPRIDMYLEMLLQDVETWLLEFGVIDIPTLYIGGGTPSILGASRIKRLLAGLTGLCKNMPHEITVEANPESADEAFLSACKESGVTRISLGIQSFKESSCKAVNRFCKEALLMDKLSLVRDIFGTSFSADLMTGLPFQDTALVVRDIEQLLLYEPDHVSLYALTLESGTPLEQKASMLPDADTADTLWITGRDALEQAGYEQYEVSNFSFCKETQSAHNIRYWRMENWLGLGPGASSTIINDEQGTGRRYTFIPDVEQYMSQRRYFSAQNVLITEELAPLTLMKETLLMGFRYIEGPDTALFEQRFHRPLEACIPNTMAVWRDKGLLAQEKPALTKQGLLFLDHFLIDAFKELDKSSFV